MKNKRTLKKDIKRFFKPLKHNKSLFWLWTLIYFVWAVDRIIHVLFLERLISLLENRNSEDFYFTLKIYLAYLVFYWFFVFSFRKRWWTEMSDTIIKYVQRKYLKSFIQLDNNEVDKQWTWKLMAIINKWIDRWGRSLDMFINDSMNVIVSFSFTSYILLKNGYNYFLWFVFFVIITGFVSYKLNLWAIKYRNKRRDNLNLHTKHFTKVVMNKQEIMQSWKILNEVDTLDFYKNKEIFHNKKMWNYLEPLFQWPKLVMSLFIIIIFFFLWGKYMNWEVQISAIVWMVSALIIMKGSVEKAIEFFKNFTKEFTDIEKLWDFFDKTPTMKWYETWKDFEYKKWKIEIKNLNYSYVKNKPVFENLNLKIKWWKVTAFVGNSWSWKSTLVKLIAGYIRADSGEVIIDGQKLNDVKLKSFYKNIWYLTQDPSVFDGSILDNLMYGVENNIGHPQGEPLQNKQSRDVWQKYLTKIIKQSKCEFIYDLEKWLETEIWERWVRLSWGQKQRLAIAKIMLKDPKIIILDEPTSALDSFSEEQITYAMHNLFKNRTVIIIAHRLQTVKEASDIILFENWKIKERWTHKELVKLKWDYNKMLKLQSGF